MLLKTDKDEENTNDEFRVATQRTSECSHSNDFIQKESEVIKTDSIVWFTVL